nr:helix-turn-helix domain-containing protein [Novosphingobium mathurense]
MSNDEIARADPARARSPFLTTRQAAHYLGLTPRHLERLRRLGGGPLFRRHGRYVFYHLDDLIAWSRRSLSEKIGD